MISATDLALSGRIEDRLVRRNPRGMQYVQAALAQGYCLRGAALIYQNKDRVLIGTGFPVAGSFETDGPVGAIALYQALESLGGKPAIACGSPLFEVLQPHYRSQRLKLQKDGAQPAERSREAQEILERQQPTAIVSIERPGLSASGHYFNMFSQDISDHCACFDECFRQASCPTIAIGDGGNEIGMGNVRDTIAKLDIEASATHCDELLVADVSNWAAYAIIAFWQKWSGKPLLEQINVLDIMEFLSSNGSVDGTTGKNTLTEDGLPLEEGLSLLVDLTELISEATT